jgi:hypothetical protein
LNLVIVVKQNGRRRWGFELTALDNTNSPIGTFIIVDPMRTQLSVDGGTGREYVKHTASGTDPGVRNRSPGWTLKWASPALPHGPVTFYTAVAASNNNNTLNGEFIYTTSITYDANQTDVVGESWGAIKKLFK